MVCCEIIIKTRLLTMMKRYYSRWIEKHSWLLLLFLVIPGLLLNDDNYIIATYSYLVIILPVILYWLLNPGVIAQMARFRATGLFALFLVYSMLSIFWSSDGYATHVSIRCIGACVILTLCYLSTHYQPQKLPLMEKALLFGGTVCLLLTLYQRESGFSLHNIQDGHGAFDHHVYISWLAGVLLLLLLSGRSKLSLTQCALFCFFMGCIILSGGRGGLLVFFCGYLCMIFRQDNRYREKQVILCLIIPTILIFTLNPLDLLKMINKGGSSRYEIFQVHFQKTTDTANHFVFGRGLNTNTDLMIKNKKLPHFHSIYLTALYKEGILGLFLYMFMLLYIIYQGLRTPDPQPWLYIVIGMSVALAVDASDFFVWPSALMTCFVIPLFLTLFSTPLKNTRYEKTPAATTGQQ
jgi:hypothetical protein